MIASLPMYDRPETADATDRLWNGIRDGLRARGIEAPESLQRGEDPWRHWQAPDLVLSQTCGLPFAARLKGEVTLLGVPVLDLPDCPPGRYFSVIVARPGTLPETPRIAVNEPLSQSGWANFHAWLGDRPRGKAVMTGAHRASAKAVQEGRADLAALDAQSWWLMTQHDPWATELEVIDRTPAIHGLPFISRPGMDAQPMQDAIAEAVDSLSSADRHALNLMGFVTAVPEDYADRTVPPAP